MKSVMDLEVELSKQQVKIIFKTKVFLYDFGLVSFKRDIIIDTAHSGAGIISDDCVNVKWFCTVAGKAFYIEFPVRIKRIVCSELAELSKQISMVKNRLMANIVQTQFTLTEPAIICPFIRS